MHYAVLSTGSCGNCYVFHEDSSAIIIDCGVTYAKLSRGLEMHGIPLEDVKAMFLTHLHPDHSKGVGVFQRKTGIPVFLSDIALERNGTVIDKQRIERSLLAPYCFGEDIVVDGFSVHPFRTSHDSEGSAGYRIVSKGNVSIFLMTDTGVIPDEAASLAENSDVKFIESNYDEDMLENGPYPVHLRKRISGTYGHLSNTKAVEFARSVSRQGDSVYFVHISANCNSPGVLRPFVMRSIPSGIFCRVCERGETFEGFKDAR